MLVQQIDKLEQLGTGSWELSLYAPLCALAEDHPGSTEGHMTKIMIFPCQPFTLPKFAIFHEKFKKKTHYGRVIFPQRFFGLLWYVA